MINTAITIKNNEVYFAGERIGGVCYKPQGHWTAYVATPTGDEVVGQHPSQGEAAVAIDAEDARRTAADICEFFEVD